MSKDNYDFLYENPQIAKDMGISEEDLQEICRELKRDDLAHQTFEALIEKRVCQINVHKLKKIENF